MILRTLASLAILILWGAFSVLNAQVLVNWDFDGIAGSDPIASSTYATTIAANISTVTDISKGDGFSRRNVINGIGYQGYSSTPEFTTADGQFIEFSVTPNTGFEMDFTSLTLDYDVGTQGPQQWRVFTSVDGFTDGNQVGLTQTVTQGTTGTLNFDLTSIAPQSGTVAIRVYGDDDSTVSNTSTDFIHFIGNNDTDIVLNGIVIPEPSTYALIIGTACLSFVIWKRRRQSNELADH